MSFNILVKAMKDQLSNSEIIKLFSEGTISKEELNKRVLSLLGNDHESNKVELGLAIELQSDLENALASDNKIIKEILEEFYKIEFCPSFLQHGTRLHQEDYKFAIEIYSNIFGLNKEVGPECWTKLSELFESHCSEMINENRKVEMKNDK